MASTAVAHRELAPSATATFRYYADLNDFIRPERRGVATPHPLPFPTTVKDATEAQGVPHVEVGAVLVDGEPATLRTPLRGGERVAVYPRLCSLQPDVTTAPPLPEPRRFVLDVHLGTLARRLRLLGFDTWYREHADDDELAAVSAVDERILLSRDLGLLKRSIVVHGAWVRATDPDRQVLEVVDRCCLGSRLAPFTRCLRCNGLLQPAGADRVAAAVPADARRRHESFHECADCHQVYWRGSHATALDAVVDAVRRHVGGLDGVWGDAGSGDG